jgi:hypothetical protein
MHKYGESMNDLSYDGSCMSRLFQSGTYEISGRLIFVGQNVHLMCTVNIMYLYILKITESGNR